MLSKDIASILKKFRSDGYIDNHMLNKLGKYMVSIKKRDFEKLFVQRLVEELMPNSGIYCTVSEKQYNPEIGLVFENIFLDEILIK